MTDNEFIELFHRQKEAFLKNYSKKDGRYNTTGGNVNSNGEQKKVLDWFERWLREERVATDQEGDQSKAAVSFDEFISEVLTQTQELLARRGIKMVYTLPGQQLGISESWKCVQVFGRRDVYYRIGRTRPRKGAYRGQELLIIDLVMDGFKKQIFIPLLNQKEELEKRLGEELERELPRVEATGKYRLKLLLPFDVVKHGNTRYVAGKLSDFISVTKPVLNNLGVV